MWGEAYFEVGDELNYLGKLQSSAQRASHLFDSNSVDYLANGNRPEHDRY